MRAAGDTYVPDLGEHAGHVVTVVATDMPAERFGRVDPRLAETWVECSCGASWGYVEDDGEPIDGDGWPE